MSKRINPKKLIEPPGHTLHRLVEQHMQETSEEDYTKALMAVVAQPENADLVVECQRWGRRLSGHE
jgi:hypothetical protein